MEVGGGGGGGLLKLDFRSEKEKKNFKNYSSSKVHFKLLGELVALTPYGLHSFDSAAVQGNFVEAFCIKAIQMMVTSKMCIPVFLSGVQTKKRKKVQSPQKGKTVPVDTDR